MDLQKYAGLAIVLILLLFLNRMLGVPQQIRLNKDLVELKRRGPVCSVGMAKSLAGLRIAVLIANKDGNILEAYKVKGISVFSGYRLDPGFKYSSCYEAKASLDNNKHLKLQDKAYLSAATYMVNGLSSQENNQYDGDQDDMLE